MKEAIIECVPNFSEGRDLKIINAIADSIRKVAGVALLHIDVGYDANRTVITFAGRPAAVVEAAFQAVKTAATLIDMRQHQGEHPRIGAVDVCPLIPVAHISMEKVQQLATALGKRIGNELELPVFLYEENATYPRRKNLARIRKGEYEGLAMKLQAADWQPDYGSSTFNPTFGAMVLGARHFLIAYNINLDTTSVELAQILAERLRTSGKIIIENRQRKRQKGKLPAVKAIGWFMEAYHFAQVSMNLTNFSLTGMHQVYEACKTEAAQLELTLNGSELIGLVPLQALLDAGQFYAPTASSEVAQIEAAIHHLGLDTLSPFSPEERILEYRLAQFDL